MGVIELIETFTSHFHRPGNKINKNRDFRSNKDQYHDDEN